MNDEETRLEPLLAVPQRGEPEEASSAEPAAETGLGRDPEAGADAGLEAALRQALRPVDLPAGFAERVLARVDTAAPVSTGARGKLLAFPGWRVALPGAIAAALVAGSLVGVNVHQTHERERARATAQFETATRITDQALEHTREQLERAGVFGR